MHDEPKPPVARTLETTFAELEGFSVRRKHHDEIAAAVAREQQETERSGELVTRQEAMQYVLQTGVHAPSAYDLIVLCNFLTQPEMTEAFEAELRGLVGPLTPGGVMLIIGSASQTYEPVYRRIQRAGGQKAPALG